MTNLMNMWHLIVKTKWDNKGKTIFKREKDILMWTPTPTPHIKRNEKEKAE